MTDVAPAETAVPEPVSQNVESTTTSETFDAAFKDIEGIMKEFKGAVSRLRQLKREIVSMEKSLRVHEERRARRKRAALDENGNKRKNGFSLDNNLISDELADFIDYERGKPISRSEVTRRLTAYIKTHDLQDKDDRRRVILDSEAGQKLKTLLSDIVDKDGNPTQLTIITLNKFVNKHYIGKCAPTSTVEEPAEEKTGEEEQLAAKKGVVIKKKKILKKKVAAA